MIVCEIKEKLVTHDRGFRKKEKRRMTWGTQCFHLHDEDIL
jgi:hypothetical protein